MPNLINKPSPNWNARPDGMQVDMLILHYTGMCSGAAALDRLCDPAAEVSAHYLIEEDGTVFALVPETARAWHAGASAWAGARDMNARSIGIELVNPGHEFGYRAFPGPQMVALIDLCRDILGRHAIPSHRVLGHSDVAPARKEDPGELFDWRRLAGDGIGLWPGDADVARYAAMPDVGGDDVAALLRKIGYDVDGAGLGPCVMAFQRHWRPARLTGDADVDCVARLRALLDLIDASAEV